LWRNRDDAAQQQVLIDGRPPDRRSRVRRTACAVEGASGWCPHELMDLVWPKLVVEETNLPHMAALRKLLGPQRRHDPGRAIASRCRSMP
jgi:hypothetical protein